MSVWLGSGVKLDIVFKDPKTKRITDPGGTAVTVTLKHPDDSKTTITATKVSDGVYEAEFIADAAGDWGWRAASDGPMPGVQEGTLTVRESSVDE